VFTNKLGRVWPTMAKHSLKIAQRKTLSTKWPRGLFIDMLEIGLRSNARLAFKRATHDQPQIIARAGSVRRGLTGLCSSSALRTTASAFERIPCVRTHFWNFLIISCPFLLPRSRHDVRACLLQNTQNKSNY
jgi:hypothetical protein